MKKKKPATPPPDTPRTDTPAGAPDLAWATPLAEAAAASQKACAEHDARQAALLAESEAAPFLAKAETPVALARAVLPGLEAYQTATAEIRALAAAMGLDTGPNGKVAKTDASGSIRNCRDGAAGYEVMRRGESTNLARDLAVILLQVQGAERQLDAYRTHLATLVQAMQETALARATHSPAGPTVQLPRPRSEPIGGPITDFDVHDFGRA